MDLHIWYTVMSAIVGGVIGARARLGEVFWFQCGNLLDSVLCCLIKSKVFEFDMS